MRTLGVTAARRGTSASGQRRGRQLVAAALALIVASVVPSPAVDARQSAPDRVVPAASDFVRLQYNDFLAREPDRAGLEFWARRIDNGTDPAALIDSMVSAPEFAETVAPMARLYKAYFLRTPDFDGLTFWVGRLNAGTPLSQVSSTFAQSDEFEQRYGDLTNTDFVQLVYRNVLGRSADSGGLAHWVRELDRGTSRGAVMTGFSESPEYVEQTFGEVRASMLYLGMLRRTPDTSGLNFWAGVIDGGEPYGNVVRGFLNSPEYQARLGRLFPRRNPLTGQAAAAAISRPALAIKVGNSPAARPQVGPEQADVIYEEMVEGNLSRLIAVFHSRTPATVGPVRSIRTTDFDVLSAMNHPLLGASGANTSVLNQLATYPIANVNAIEAGAAYRRDGGRSAPYNLFTNPSHLWSLAPAAAGTPPALFSYVPPGSDLGPSARPASGFDVDFGRTRATFRWNGARRGWLRTQDGSAHVDHQGVQYAPTNVVVMVNDYITSSADSISPEAVTVGVGQAWFYTAGQRQECFWSRDANTDVIRFTTREGPECHLQPGSTWVVLAPPRTISFR